MIPNLLGIIKLIFSFYIQGDIHNQPHTFIQIDIADSILNWHRTSANLSLGAKNLLVLAQ